MIADRLLRLENTASPGQPRSQTACGQVLILITALHDSLKLGYYVHMLIMDTAIGNDDSAL